MEKLVSEYIPVVAMMGPYWPFFTDVELLFRRFKEVGVSHVFSESFNTVGGNWTGVKRVLEENYPKILPEIEDIFFNKNKFFDYYSEAEKKINELSKKYKIPATVYFGLGHAAKFK